MILLILAACGIDQESLDQPLPPPTPPAELSNDQPDIVHQSGLVSDVHGPTRSFVLTGEGKRAIVHLSNSATMKLGGKPAQVSELVAGTVLYVEGKRFGDFLLASAAADTADDKTLGVPSAITEAAAAEAAAAAAVGNPASPAPVDAAGAAATPAPADPAATPVPAPTEPVAPATP